MTAGLVGTSLSDWHLVSVGLGGLAGWRVMRQRPSQCVRTEARASVLWPVVVCSLRLTDGLSQAGWQAHRLTALVVKNR